MPKDGAQRSIAEIRVRLDLIEIALDRDQGQLCASLFDIDGNMLNSSFVGQVAIFQDDILIRVIALDRDASPRVENHIGGRSRRDPAYQRGRIWSVN